MAYEKLNLPDGTVLRAGHVAHMEEGIANAVAFDTDQGLTDKQKTQARANIGAATVADVLAALPTWTGGAY